MKASRETELVLLLKFFGLTAIATLFFGFINNYDVEINTRNQSTKNQLMVKTQQPLTKNKEVAIIEGDVRGKKITGNELFQNNCAACHGVDRKGNPPTFPSLIDVDKKLNKEQIESLLETGRNIMPSFNHLSKEERKAIVGYLFGQPTVSEVTSEFSPIDNGKNLFIANCTRCHKITPSDETPKDQNIRGMRPPILGGISERYSKETFIRIVNMGPWYMPSFTNIENRDKEDIYAYLSTFKKVYTNSNRRMNRGCNMMSN